jgi:hypothetical protein
MKQFTRSGCIGCSETQASPNITRCPPPLT